MTESIRYKMRTALITAAILFICSAVHSDELHQEDGIMSNHSTEYVRTLNRNTSTDTDAAFYNPAGLAFMGKNGLHLSFSSQTYYVKKTHSTDFYALKKDTDPVAVPPHKQTWFRGDVPEEYTAQLLAPVLPGFDVIWKEDKWAAYFDLAVMQAAIDMTFPDGLGVIDWGNLLNRETQMDTSTDNLILYSRNSKAVRNEMYLGFTLGGVYKILNWLSAGGGLRTIYARGNMKINVTDINFVQDNILTSPNYKIETMDDWDIDTDTSGVGFGFIFSTHIKPEGFLPVLKGLDGTVRAEYYPTMELQKKTNRFYLEASQEASGNADIFKDGSPVDNMTYAHGNGSKTLKVTYPSTINLGLSYMITDWIKIMSSSQISFRQYRDLDGREKAYNPGYQAGIAAEFILTPAVTVSSGYLYNNFGIKPEMRSEADPLLDSHQIGAGARLKINDDLDLNLGAFYQYFVPATVYTVKFVHVSEPTWSYLKKDFSESRLSISIGITYRMFSSESSVESEQPDEAEEPVVIKKVSKTKNIKAKKKI